MPNELTEVYVDTSVLVSLLAPDDVNHKIASDIFKKIYTLKSTVVSSVITEVELLRSLNRRGASNSHYKAANNVLRILELVDIIPEIRVAASKVVPTSTRSLDAIHIATALVSDVKVFITFDKRQEVSAQESFLISDPNYIFTE